ncbi:phage portal protein family protein [Pedobacter sp. MW01-1-1]|uniref:phage portal protein family protein n=1 Tax=Pedobacter sp. MW01-1-1 TaxID=3383027 RepID=UPI003FEF3BA9
MAKTNALNALNAPKVKKQQTIRIETVSQSSPKKQDTASVMVQVIKQQRSLYSKDISHWIASKQSALNPDFPNRSRLHDIFDDMMDDDFIYGLIYNQRIMPVKNRSNKIVSADGKKDDQKTQLFQQRWFDEVLTYAMESRLFGHSLIYLKSLVPQATLTNCVELIPRRNVIPELGMIKTWESDFTGISYLDEPISPWVISIGRKDDLGLLNKCVPLWIIKKHGWQNWDEFAERFGIPIIAVKTASQDKRVIAEIEEWARELSTGAYGVFPDGTDFDIKENAKTDAFKVFAEMIRMAQEALAILIVGQTMTSMDGASLSQAEVHASIKDEIRKDDEKFIKYEIAILLNKLSTYHGWPIELTDRFEFDVPEDVKGLLEVFKTVNEMGFQLNAEEVSTRLGVKIDGIKTAAAAKEDSNSDLNDPNAEAKNKKANNLSVSNILNMHADIAKIYSAQ